MNAKAIRKLFNITGISLLLIFMFIIPNTMAGKVQLPKDKTVKVSFDPGKEISSGKLKTGDTVKIVLVEPIEIGGVSIVESGATGKAVVVEAKKAGWFHKKGSIKVEFVELDTKGEFRAADGGKIKLSGVLDKKGGIKFFPSILPFLIGKGGQGKISSSAIYAVTVKESIFLESK
jgi:hypothetical protein